MKIMFDYNFNSSIYGKCSRTRTFSERFQTSDELVNSYEELGFPKSEFVNGDQSLRFIWLLLIGRYANSHLAGVDENQTVIEIMSKIWQFGPTWEKRVDVQRKLRSLSLDEGSELFVGSEAIYNTALNPGTEVADEDTYGQGGKLKYINAQNTTQYRKSKVEGLTLLNTLLETDLTEEFLSRFKPMFKIVVQPEEAQCYDSIEAYLPTNTITQ